MQEIFYFDGHKSEKMIIKRVQDVEPVIDEVTEERNTLDNGFGIGSSRNYRKIASIPMIIVEQWLREGFNIFKGDEKELRRRINEYTKFRTVDKPL